MGVNFFFFGRGGGAERRERMCPKEHQNTLLSQCKSNDWFLYEMQHWTEMTEWAMTRSYVTAVMKEDRDYFVARVFSIYPFKIQVTGWGVKPIYSQILRIHVTKVKDRTNELYKLYTKYSKIYELYELHHTIL